MKSEDIVKQLMAALPPQTDLFTDKLSVAALSSTGFTANVNAVAHGLGVSDLVSIVGSQVDAPISSLTRLTTIASATTSADHDLTFDAVESAHLKIKGETLTVTISGATEPEFNGTFELLSVLNRTSFTFKVADSGPTTATGSPVLVDGIAFGYNGTFNVTVVNDVDNFEYTLPVSGLPVASGTILLKKNYRMSRIVNFDRAVNAYTKKNLNDLWIFVETNDVASSKDRRTQSDAVANLGRTNDVRQQLLFPFTIFVFSNVTEDISGAGAKDLMLDVMELLFKSLIGKQFKTQLASTKTSSSVFIGHGTAFYDTAIYVHSFQFEAVADISFDDSVGYDTHVAFRDIELGFDLSFDISDNTETPDFDNAQLKTTIDLDETP